MIVLEVDWWPGLFSRARALASDWNRKLVASTDRVLERSLDLNVCTENMAGSKALLKAVEQYTHFQHISYLICLKVARRTDCVALPFFCIFVSW